MPASTRQTGMSCSPQSATRPHCSEFVMWALEHKVQWREDSWDLFLQKTWSPWGRTTTKRTRYSLCKLCKVSWCYFRQALEKPNRKGLFKTLLTYVEPILYSSGRLSTNTKLALYNALIRLVMTYGCPTWVYAADAHLLELRRLQHSALFGNLDRRTSVWKLHVACVII
jgi:hypothetical protein